MRAAKAIAYALIILPAAEFVVFVGIAYFIGVPAAILLLVLVSLSGVLVLRRLGSGAMERLRAGLGSRGIADLNRASGQIGAALGGILLIVPGFITGLLGAATLFRPSRLALIAVFRLLRTPRRPSGPDVIDLDPNEWRRLPDR